MLHTLRPTTALQGPRAMTARLVLVNMFPFIPLSVSMCLCVCVYDYEYVCGCE